MPFAGLTKSVERTVAPLLRSVLGGNSDAPFTLLFLFWANASQMWRFGSPYYWPLTFVALTVAGIVILPNKLEAKSRLPRHFHRSRTYETPSPS